MSADDERVIGAPDEKAARAYAERVHVPNGDLVIYLEWLEGEPPTKQRLPVQTSLLVVGPRPPANQLEYIQERPKPKPENF